MHVSIRKIASVALAVAVGACSDDDGAPADIVSTQSNPSADFTSYQTFRFLTQDDMPSGMTLNLPRDVLANLDKVNDAMREELLEQGLSEVAPTAAADLLAFTLASTTENEALYWDCVEGYWWGYWTYAWEPCAWLEPVYTDYETGTVFVGLIDPLRNEIVYSSVMQGVIYGDEDDMEDRLEGDMSEAFDQYPAAQTGL